MHKYIEKDVFIIINHYQLGIIKEIKEKLREYHINLNIYRKDEEFKKLLSTDTIVVFDKELLLDYGYLKHIESLVRMKRAVHLYKLDNIDISDLTLFFNVCDIDVKLYQENNSLFLMKLVLSLKTFQTKYHNQNYNIDKMFSKDRNFICLLEFYLKENIKDKEYLKELLPLSKKEFDDYFGLLEKLLIPHMNILQLKELLPFTYQQVFKKTRYEFKLNNVINEMYYEKEYLMMMLEGITVNELNRQYDEYLDAVLQRDVINNTFITILHKLEVIRIVDGEIRNVLSNKDINSIKMFLENKFLKDIKEEKVLIDKKLCLNYVDDIRIRSFFDFHKTNKHNMVKSIIDADIVISLISKKSIVSMEFLNNIKYAVDLNKKLLFIYLDKCDLSISIKYLIGFSDNMCYWAYKRIDTFFNKYLEKLNNISSEENKEIRSNIVRLK